MNLLSEDVRRNPFPVYLHMRQAAPVFQDPRTGLWMLFDYENVKRVLHETGEFSSNLGAAANQPTPPWMIFSDPPRHTRLRSLIQRAFTPRMIAELEPRIRELSRRLLDEIETGETIDLAAAFSVPLPLLVIAGMIGIPPADWARFRRWSDVILLLSYTAFDSAASAQATAGYLAVTDEMKAYLPELTAQRKTKPVDDLLTRLGAAEIDGEQLSDEEILAFVQLLIVAGNETTSNLINNAVLCFAEYPQACAQVRKKPELLPAAIEEVLRYRSPLQFMYRATRRDVDIQGQLIPAGKIVLAMIGSANRDPRVFPEPDRFDILRDPNPHLAFGHGIHFCLGAALSRLEARIALEGLLAHFERFELASQEPWQPRPALHVHGPARLLIRGLAARSPVGA